VALYVVNTYLLFHIKSFIISKSSCLFRHLVKMVDTWGNVFPSTLLFFGLKSVESQPYTKTSYSSRSRTNGGAVLVNNNCVITSVDCSLFFWMLLALIVSDIFALSAELRLSDILAFLSCHFPHCYQDDFKSGVRRKRRYLRNR